MADRIMVISDGKLDSIGPTAEIMPQLLGEDIDSCACMKEKGGDICEA